MIGTVELLGLACIAMALSEIVTALCKMQHTAYDMIPTYTGITAGIDAISIKLTLDSDDGNSEEGCCAICLEEHKECQTQRLTACGHIFCAKCFEQWYAKNPKCPLCNYEFPKTT